MLSPTNTLETPSGGYTFTDSDGFVTFSSNPTDFINKIGAHRITAGLYVGSGWEQEVWHLACEQNPNLACHDKENPTLEAGLEDVRQFGLVTQRFFENGGKAESQKEAERRASICASCPKNQPIAGLCSSCKGWAAWLIQLASGRHTSRDNDLFYCQVCGCSNKLATHVPLDVQRDERHSASEAPANCWKRQAFVKT